MHKYIKHGIVILIAIVIGIIYHMIYLSAVPQDTNCTFIANPYTDMFAVIFGVLFIYLGIFEYDSIILTIGGGSIITEHIMQISHKSSNFVKIKYLEKKISELFF